MPDQNQHILVCISPAPSAGSILRTAHRMAEAFGARLTALYVESPDKRLGPEDRQRLEQHMALARSLGAEVSTAFGEDVAGQIAQFARLVRATKVVLGRSGKKRPFRERPLTERLVEAAPTLEIYIIPDALGQNKGARPDSRPERPLPTLKQWAVTAALLAGATALSAAFAALGFTEANIITVYIFSALLDALWARSALCSLVSSLMGVLLFNFFFTEPRLSFRAYDSGYPVTFAIMLCASLLTGTLARRLGRHAEQSARSAARSGVLYETSQLLQQADEERAVWNLSAVQLRKLLDRPLVVRPREGRDLIWPLEGAPYFDGTDPDRLEVPVRLGEQVLGTLLMPPDPPLDPFERSILEAMLTECALALQGCQAAREKAAAEGKARSEQLRADLLRAISHDLRTPLTAISGNAENLWKNAGLLEPAVRESLAQSICQDADWLIRLVENLLAITRIGDGRAGLRLSAQLADEVITESLRHLRGAEGHTVRCELEELLLAKMDARLISQVVLNLVDNAVKYTPPGSVITVSARRVRDRIAISVSDNGPGIPAELKPQVFEMFFTGREQPGDLRRSMGLGLALCRSIVEAHGGAISLRDNQPSGCIFSFELPASEVTVHE